MTVITNPDYFPEEKQAHFFLEGPAGLLEVMTTVPKDDANLGVGIVCHPHPLQEGAMTNKVVHTAAKALENSGFKTIRFNFRGVGQSQGSFADAIGETDDLMAVINWVDKVLNPNYRILAGFSFGAYVAARGATKWPVDQLITIAPGVKNYSFDTLKAVLAPWFIIQGGQDDVVDVKDVKAWAEAQDGHKITLEIIEDAGHFFHGKLIELRELIQDNLIKQA